MSFCSQAMFQLSPPLQPSVQENSKLEEMCIYACLEENYMQNVLSPVAYYEFPDSGEYTRQQIESCTHACKNMFQRKQ